MNPNDVYVFDATALIDLHNHFPKSFRKLRKYVSNGQVKIPEGVYREIKRKSDKLRKYVERWEIEHQFVIAIKNDIKLVNEFGRIEQSYGEKINVGDKVYPGFWKSPAGRKAADGQVVVIGKVYKYTVVSDDRAVRYACLSENVQCIGWPELARRVGLAGNNQISLDFEWKDTE